MSSEAYEQVMHLQAQLEQAMHTSEDKDVMLSKLKALVYRCEETLMYYANKESWEKIPYFDMNPLDVSYKLVPRVEKAQETLALINDTLVEVGHLSID